VTSKRVLIVAALVLAAATAGAAWLLRSPAPEPAPTGAKLPSPGFPGGRPIRAEEISEGRLVMERLPVEIGDALQTHSSELIKNAEAIERKQARISGTCAPGSAIRVIAEDGSVSCQRLPRGVISVPALAGVPRLSSTGTAQGTVKGGVGRFQTSGEDDFLVVPVALPDAAVVTGFSYAFYDADPKVEGAAYLYRSDDQPMAALGTSGAADEVRVVSTEEIQLRRVDASRYAYFVYFQVSAEAGANLVPISASVAYRLP
jgi:hypothetical protein